MSAPQPADAQARIADLEAECKRLRGELENIVNAKRFDRTCFDNDTAFADWAQSRARHSLAGGPSDQARK